MDLDSLINGYCNATGADPDSKMSLLTDEMKEELKREKERQEFIDMLHNFKNPHDADLSDAFAQAFFHSKKQDTNNSEFTTTEVQPKIVLNESDYEVLEDQ